MATAPKPGSFHAWIIATRPKTLTAGAAPVLVGSALAWHHGAFRPLPGLAALFGALLLQIGSNFANDVFDFEKGSDTDERLGPVRAVQAGLITPAAMKRGMIFVFLLAIALGVYLTAASGPWIVVVGLLSVASAILYTGGPYPLGYHGLGDLFVLLFFGLAAVAGTTFVHLSTVPPIAWLYATALGALAVNILVVNNVRDRHTDVKSGKRTLAVRFGRGGAEFEFLTMYGLAYAAPVFAFAFGFSGPWPLLAFVSLPLAIKNYRELRGREGRPLNETLGNVAKLVFVFAVLTALGLFVDVHFAGRFFS